MENAIKSHFRVSISNACSYRRALKHAEIGMPVKKAPLMLISRSLRMLSCLYCARVRVPAYVRFGVSGITVVYKYE
jgi:hypothetical protein